MGCVSMAGQATALLLLYTLAGVESKPTCCWSKWGDDSTCGSYDGSGAQCNTDHSKSCNSDGDCPDTPAPAPTPAPPAPPAPPSPPSPPSPPAPPSPAPSELIGYWAETWSPTAAPSNANIGIAFSGWNNPAEAKAESDPIHDQLVGDKWIDAGGGNANGRWSADWLSKWEDHIKNGSLKAWSGIVFDIEECSSSGLATNFASAFRTAKAAGMGVLVTTSHSAPYGCSDPHELMTSFFSNDDIDYLSPQLYTNGNEPSPSFDAGNQVKWSDWTGSKARFVPSMGCLAVKNGGYQKVQDYFKTYDLAATGYIVWPSSGCSLSADFVI